MNEEVLAEFITQCRWVNTHYNTHLARAVRISELRKTYQVKLCETGLSQNDAKALLAKTYKAEFHPV